ncbi:uncharacterized protein LOC119669272 [Teleopsis dalmanni]|uniref:uncharacterized protein LOC119669272 n=1 Tax=Teleopsis dalmanni TaxID=139649 RepID=UPI0018CDA00D|nr:uncharacterized protein LOC119669272 [Teleopsis dalmanni]
MVFGTTKRDKFFFICGFFLASYIFFKGMQRTEIMIEKNLKPNEYLVLADVLTDFPDKCFAATHCKLFEIGETWNLKTTCGRSTCLRDEFNKNRLFEKVETCEFLPPIKEKCTSDNNRSNIVAPYPNCCPQYVCEEQSEQEATNERNEEVEEIERNEL